MNRIGKIFGFRGRVTWSCGLVVMLSVVALATTSLAGPVLYTPETWTNGLSGWANDPVGYPGDGTVANPSEFLALTFGAQPVGPPPSYEEDTLYTTGAAWTGDFQNVSSLGVRFDFYAEDIAPGSVVLFMHSAVSDSLWQYALSGFSVGVLSTQTVGFSYDYGGQAWAGPVGTDSTDFWDDLANIDWIGVNIARSLNTMEQTYRIDNWQYVIVPEPGSICVIATALLSLAFTLKRRKRVVG